MGGFTRKIERGSSAPYRAQIEDQADYVPEIPRSSARRHPAWIAARGRVRSGTGVAGAKMLGVSLDITDRKRAEQTLEERLRFERLLADLSAAFINQPPDRIDGIIDDSLKRPLETLGHDRSSLAQFSEDRGHALVTHSCAVPGVEPSPVGVLADDHVPWIVGQVRNGKTVFLKCLPDDLPPEAKKERQLSVATGIKSTVAIPLKAGGSVLGLLAFSFLRQHREWPPEVVSRLQMIAEIFANAWYASGPTRRFGPHLPRTSSFDSGSNGRTSIFVSRSL